MRIAAWAEFVARPDRVARLDRILLKKRILRISRLTRPDWRGGVEPDEDPIVAVPSTAEYNPIVRVLQEVRMSDRRRLFIGSSSTPRSLEVVEIIKELLETAAEPPVEVVPWYEEFPPGSKTTIERLEEIAPEFDFALMVFGDDDEIRVDRKSDDTMTPRDDTTGAMGLKAPRDNVIFELGLFIGLIGRERCIVVHDEGMDLKLPSDIKGIIFALYNSKAAGNLRGALEIAVDKIRRTLGGRVLPKRPRPSEIKAWEAARQFSQNIAGCWWTKRLGWGKDSIGFVELSVESASSMPKVLGRAFHRDGTRVAQWFSDATCVVPVEGKLYFRFTGDHPPTRPRKGKENSEEYRGFSEYTFDPPLDHPVRGHGALWDLNLSSGSIRTRLLLDLERCRLDEANIETIKEGSDRAGIARIVQKTLPPPSASSRHRTPAATASVRRTNRTRVRR
jgi:predicted nucleotide-binding protein